jgi:hypothetical protein
MGQRPTWARIYTYYSNNLDLWDIQMYLVNLGTSQMKLLHVDYKMLNSISFGSARSPPSGENIM